LVIINIRFKDESLNSGKCVYFVTINKELMTADFSWL